MRKYVIGYSIFNLTRVIQKGLIGELKEEELDDKASNSPHLLFLPLLGGEEKNREIIRNRHYNLLSKIIPEEDLKESLKKELRVMKLSDLTIKSGNNDTVFDGRSSEDYDDWRSEWYFEDDVLDPLPDDYDPEYDFGGNEDLWGEDWCFECDEDGECYFGPCEPFLCC